MCYKVDGMCNETGEYMYLLSDARGMPVANVCWRCEDEVRKRYRLDIFTDSDYWHDEPINEEDY
jgi:hypothetical protein